jgi:hypothetical protein
MAASDVRLAAELRLIRIPALTLLRWRLHCNHEEG